MKRQLNGKFLLVLVISAAALGGGIVLLHSVQVGRSTKALLAQADRAEAQGDLARTEDYLSRYLHYQAGDVKALARYARLREQRAQTPAEQTQVVQLYETLLRLAPDDNDARRRLVDLVMGLDDHITAKRHLAELVKADPGNAELNDLLGRCEEAAGRPREARTFYETAREQDPTRLNPYVRLAELLREKLNDKTEADRLMIADPRGGDLIATLLKRKVAGKDLAAAYLARARYRERWKLDGVNDDVALALKQAPDDADSLLAAATVAQRSGDLSKAADLLKQGVKVHPGRGEFHDALARLELQAGRPAEAVTALRQGIKAAGDDPAAIALQWTLADTLISMNQLKEADRIVADLKAKANVRPELLGFLDGRLQMGRTQWAPAVKTLETAETVLATRPETRGLAKRALLMIASCHERLGNPDQRYVAARQAAAVAFDDPSLFIASHMELAAALTALNRLDEALVQYRLVLPREPRAGLNIAQIEIARTLRQPEPQRDWTAVDQTLDDLERTTPDSAELAILRAETLVARKDLKAARTRLRQALDRHPDQIVLWTALANLTERDQGGKAALEVLDDAGKRLGDRLELRLARSNFWARQGGPDAPSALAALEKNIEAFTSDQRDRLERELGAAYTRVGQADDARRLWSELADRQPGDLNIRLLLFNLAMTRADADEATRRLDQIRAIEGDNGVFWRFGQARLLIEQVRKDPTNRKALTEARDLLARVAEQRPTWAWVVLAQAELAELDGRTEAAIQSYTHAVLDLGDRTPSALKRLLELLHQHQRHEQALALVQQLRKEGPISTGLQNLAADLAYQTHDYGQALELAQQSIPEQSDNYLDQLRLGQYHWHAGKPAEPYFRRALALKPAEPAARVALIAYLADAKRTKDVDKELAEADRALPAESAPLGLAQCYQAAGRLDRAGELFEKARQQAPNNVPTLRASAAFYLQANNPARAQALLNEIITLTGDSDEADWARRSLAQLLALRGGHQAAVKALEVLDQPSQSDAKSRREATPENLRTRAKILATQPSTAKRTEAIAILNGLVERRQAVADDLFLLAQLFDAAGDWPKAREHALKLLDQRGNNPTYLAYYITALVRHKRAGEAQVYLDQLKALAPGQAGTIVVEAQVRNARERPNEAVALIRSLHDKGVDPLTVARALEGLEQYDAAEADFRAAARSGQDRQVLALAEYLGRRGKTTEALDLCEKLWNTAAPAKVASSSVAILYRADADDHANQRRVADKIAAAAKAHPETLSLQFDLANVQTLLGQYDQAETIFRTVYDRDQTRGSSLNNLAWMLSLRGSRATEAVDLANRAIQLDGEAPDLLDTRAVAHLAAGQTDLAIRDLENALAVSPKPEMYFHLARAYAQSGRRDDAAASLKRARDLGLSASGVHPLERATYNQLVGDLASR